MRTPSLFIGAALGAMLLPGAGRSATEEPLLEEIVVTAQLRETSARELPASVSVLDAAELEAVSVQHFEELTLRVPNLNWSGDGSRARYFQLRGIGELEQYEGAPNPSVGFIIDDIDFSSLGSIATLFDAERVEVLRGPQGTRYGSNALAGLIYMRSSSPSEDFEADFETSVGNDGTLAAGVALGGPLTPALAYRFSLHQYQSNGFRRNVFLGRDDTYGRDEISTRGKLRWEPGERVTVDLTALYVDIDNGYDAWTIDNGLQTYSDNPGKDSQRSMAGSARVVADFDRFDLISISGAARSDVTFSFDADWGNNEFWAPFIYDFVSLTSRDRETYNQELRLLSEDGAIANGRGEWLLGVYAFNLRESNDRIDQGIYDDDFFCDPCLLDVPAASDYDAMNRALFGQVALDLSARLELTAGLRWERRSADYRDTFGNRFDPTDNMLGGDLALSWLLDDRLSAYLRLARGYKGGGFNVAFAGVDFDDVDTVTPDQLEFDPEFLWTIEFGVKGEWLAGRLSSELSVFYSRRDDQQIKIPLQLRLGDPSSFLFLTENAERGQDTGLEAEMVWRPADRIAVFGSLGLLDTEIERFSLLPALEGREQAHAPRYTFSLGAEYTGAQGWWGRVDVLGRDAFFFDYSHGQKSESYALVNMRIGREWGPWSVSFWARNVLDREYAVRGFFFGNEPPDFPDTLYTRLGDPRHYGLTVKYRL